MCRCIKGISKPVSAMQSHSQHEEILVRVLELLPFLSEIYLAFDIMYLHFSCDETLCRRTTCVYMLERVDPSGRLKSCISSTIITVQIY